MYCKRVVAAALSLPRNSILATFAERAQPKKIARQKICFDCDVAAISSLRVSNLRKFPIRGTNSPRSHTRTTRCDLVGSKSDLTAAGIADCGRLGEETHGSDISTTFDCSIARRARTRRNSVFVGKTRLDFRRARDESTITETHGRVYDEQGSSQCSEGDEAASHGVYTTTVKARGVVCSRVYVECRDRIDPTSSRHESQRSPTLIECPAISLSLALSLSLSILFLFLSFSISLARSDAVGQLCISVLQPREQLFLYFFLILRDHARLPLLSRSFSGSPSDHAEYSTPNLP